MILVDYFLEKALVKRGFDKKRAARFIKNFFFEWKKSPRGFSEKLWAAKHGFYADKLDIYSLNEENYRNYLSDYDRLWLHPFNNHFAFWINDKITLKYMLQKPFVIDGVEYDVMPEYYLYIENDGHYTYLMDSPSVISHDKDYLFNLLKMKKELAVKLTNGEKGKGFYKLQYIDGVVFSNGELLEENFSDFEKSLKGYVITEYCHHNNKFNEVWDKSECTLRVIMLKNIEPEKRYDGGEYFCIGSFARFGTSLSGGASNLSAGGVGIAFDFDSGVCHGKFIRESSLCSSDDMTINYHPDSRVSWEGKELPNYDIVKKAILAICDHLGSLEMLGLDIIITDGGLKICEINSLPAIDVCQIINRPVYLNKDAVAFINRKKEKKIRI